MASHVPWAKKSHKHLCGDSLLGAAAAEHGPPTITTRTKLFEVLVESVVGQQLSGKAADAIYGKFVALVETVEPKKIAKHSADELRAAGLSGAKAHTILGIASAASNGLDFEKFWKTPDEEIVETLIKLKGIGRWTAEMFLMFGLGRPDVMSAADLGLRKGLAVAYRLPELPNPKDCERLFEPWRPYRTAASWYLWRIAEKGISG